MGFVIGLLTFVMVLDCLALMLLVLIQLPKKENAELQSIFPIKSTKQRSVIMPISMPQVMQITLRT